MLLSTLHLQDFRNFHQFDITFSPHTTLIQGANGVGKTNILEAIMLLATGKSFHAEVDREMIGWGCEIARVKGGVEDVTLELVLTTGTVGETPAPNKKFLVNGVPRRMIDFAGNLKAVLFWPQDLELVTDSPSVRRKYLDRVLVQVDREYRRNIQSYERGLRQRNKLLDLIQEGTASRSQLLFWNQLLIKSGGYLTDKRAEFIEYINTSQNHSYQLEYDKSVISETRLEEYANEEIAAKATLVGPHRDDFNFQLRINNYELKTATMNKYRDLSKYGSRGEQRLGVLWLKLAELSYILQKTNDRPILLLDDIFSELDLEHRKTVLRLIRSYQTVLTSAVESTKMLLDQEKLSYEMLQL